MTIWVPCAVLVSFITVATSKPFPVSLILMRVRFHRSLQDGSLIRKTRQGMCGRIGFFFIIGFGLPVNKTKSLAVVPRLHCSLEPVQGESVLYLGRKGRLIYFVSAKMEFPAMGASMIICVPLPGSELISMLQPIRLKRS